MTTALVSWLKGPDIPREKRWSPGYVINLVSISAIVMILLIEWTLSCWRLGLDFSPVKCLDGTGYLIHNDAPQSPMKGVKYAYRSHGLAPLLADGSSVVKIAAASPGDRVVINANGIYINGAWWGPLNATVLQKTHRTVGSVTRSFVVAPGQVLMLGDQPRSYDGRYWGPIQDAQLIGRAWRLW